MMGQAQKLFFALFHSKVKIFQKFPTFGTLKIEFVLFRLEEDVLKHVTEPDTSCQGKRDVFGKNFLE